MKKLLLAICIACCLFTNLKAQQYYPLLDSVNSWSYAWTILGLRLGGNHTQSVTCGYPSGTTQYYTNQDTTIHSIVYKNLYATALYDNDTCLFGFLREDTSARKVYFQDVLDSPEIALYDFSMQLGDSIRINFIDSGDYFANGIYILDSVSTVTIKAGVRRVFYLNCTCNNSSTLIWIESVGNLGDAIYSYSENQSPRQLPSCASLTSNFSHITTCFEHSQLVYYDSCALQVAMTQSGYWYGDTCDYGNFIGAVHEVSSLLSCSLSPNPATKQLTIHSSSFHNEVVTVSIMNVLGEKVLSNSFSFTNGKVEIANIANLSSGVYFVKLSTEKTSWVGKFIKE